MKSSKRNLTNDHPKTFSKRADKKSVSINWNSRLFFQLGLIVSLLAVFLVIESTYGMKTSAVTSNGPEFDLTEANIPIFEIDKPKVIPVKKKVQKKVVSKRPKIASAIFKVPNNTIIETPLGTTEIDPNTPLVDNTTIINEVTNKTHNVISVEFAPIFPGCESLSSNREIIDCMSSSVNSFIRKKFRTDNFSDLKAGSKHNIYVEFKIDKKGDVVDIKTIAKHQSLEKEASRVISKLPKMTPGKQGNTNVDVIYRVPIKFNVD